MTSHAADLKSLLKDPSLLETRAYVAGEWIGAPDGRTFDVMNPARGEVIAQVADLGPEDAARAIAAAASALLTTCGGTSPAPGARCARSRTSAIT